MTKQEQLIEKQRELIDILSKMASFSTCVTNTEMMFLRSERDKCESEISALEGEIAKEKDVNLNPPFFGNTTAVIPNMEFKSLYDDPELAKASNEAVNELMNELPPFRNREKDELKMSAEEILAKYKSLSYILKINPVCNIMVYSRSDTLKAMEEYHEQFKQ